MTVSIEKIIQNICQLQIILHHADCKNRQHYHDLYLTNLRVLGQRGLADDYWPAVEWYDWYVFREAKVQPYSIMTYYLDHLPQPRPPIEKDDAA